MTSEENNNSENTCAGCDERGYIKPYLKNSKQEFFLCLHCADRLSKRLAELLNIAGYVSEEVPK